MSKEYHEIGYDDFNQLYRRPRTPQDILSNSSILSRLIHGYAYLDQRHWFFPTKAEIARILEKVGFKIITSSQPFSQRLHFLAKNNIKITL